MKGWGRTVVRMLPACTCTAVAYHYASKFVQKQKDQTTKGQPAYLDG